MRTLKTGIKLLIVFYCFIIFQHFLMRAQLRMNTAIEAVFIGTLIYLVIGFVKRGPASRWVAMAFHVVFQVMETISIYFILDPKTFAALVKELPASMAGVARSSLFAVFAVITVINLSAIVYLWKQREYFSASRPDQLEEPEV
jgi:hypothetical protein